MIDTSKYIGFTTKSLPFYSLYRRIQREEVEVFPEYKRGLIWTLTQQSQFVESIFLGIPTQPLWFEENYDGRWVVLDGGQRIASVAAFMEGELKLRGLQLLPQYNGVTFKELPLDLVMKIEDSYTFSVNLLSHDVDEQLKSEVFKRLNISGAQLTEQEVRNFLYRGSSLEALRECSDVFYKYYPFQELYGKRHLVDEFILKLLVLLLQQQQNASQESLALNNLMRDLSFQMPMIKRRLADTCELIRTNVGVIQIKRRSSFRGIKQESFVLSEGQFRILFGLFAQHSTDLKTLSLRRLQDFFSDVYFHINLKNTYKSIDYLYGWLVNDKNYQTRKL